MHARETLDCVFQGQHKSSIFEKKINLLIRLTRGGEFKLYTTRNIVKQ